MTKIDVSDLYVQEQPQHIIVHHKLLHMAISLGVEPVRAEVMASSISASVREKETVLVHCEIESDGDSCQLLIGTDGQQEKLKLPGLPDAEKLLELKQSLTSDSIPDLLLQIHAHQNRLQQRHDVLSQENERLSIKLVHKNKDIEHQSMHDTLTGLANRPLLAERANHAFQIARRQKFSCCLMVMDLNEFKHINDALGHQVGDLMLQEVGSRFKECLRSSDTLARLGGDEFAALLLNNSAEQAEIVADKLHQSLKTPFELHGHSLSTSISIGIAEFPIHGEEFSDLMQHADVAMYHAKNNKLEQMVYHSQLDQHSLERLSLFNDLKQAIEEGTMELYYQPQVLISDDGMPSLEALIR